jgi:hypothetical protein
MAFVEALQASIEVETQEAADQCFERLVALFAEHVDLSRVQVEARVRENLGYWIGYGPAEKRARLEAFYRCEHPIFGSVAECGLPTSEQCFAAGLAVAKAKSPEERKRVIADIQAELRRQHALEKEAARVNE